MRRRGVAGVFHDMIECDGIKLLSHKHPGKEEEEEKLVMHKFHQDIKHARIYIYICIDCALPLLPVKVSQGSVRG